MDQAKLHSAIEDFRFGDDASAIPALRKLLHQYPRNFDILFTLARALEESGKSDAALPFFRSLRSYYPESRDAVIFLAGLYAKMKQYKLGQKLLQTWNDAHAGDDQSMQMEMGIAVQAKAFRRVRTLAERALSRSGASSDAKAAALYFRAYAQLRDGEYDNATQSVDDLLTRFPRSSMAKPGKDLKLAIQKSERQGHASIRIGEFHSSNVPTLPQSLRNVPTTSAKPRDFGTAVDAALSYRYRNWTISYGLNGVFYRDRRNNGLELLPQNIGIAWGKASWSVGLRYINVWLGHDLLFQGPMFEANWSPAPWVVHYGLSYKAFNHHFLPKNNTKETDLGRLGGVSNDLLLMRIWSGDIDTATAGITFHDERTLGDDAHTNNSDSYDQVMALASWTVRPWQKIDLKLGVNAYYRINTTADVTVTLPGARNARRRDLYAMLKGSIGWHPWGKKSHQALSLNGQWQRNWSNYKPPVTLPPALGGVDFRFVEWRLGADWQWRY